MNMRKPFEKNIQQINIKKKKKKLGLDYRERARNIQQKLVLII